MDEEKDINQKKKEILDRINDLKVNLDAVTLIKKKLIKEKKEGIGIDFHEKDAREKKKNIMDMIRKENEMLR